MFVNLCHKVMVSLPQRFHKYSRLCQFPCYLPNFPLFMKNRKSVYTLIPFLKHFFFFLRLKKKKKNLY